MHGCNFSMDSALWLMEGRPRSTVNFELSVWLFLCATDPEAGGAERELLQCDVCGMFVRVSCMHGGGAWCWSWGTGKDRSRD